MKALPLRAIAIRILITIVNARFINVGQRVMLLGLQTLDEGLALYFISLSVAVAFFLRVKPILRRASLIFCCVTLSPHSWAI